jgi:methionyl-tRNA formyltransferase
MKEAKILFLAKRKPFAEDAAFLIRKYFKDSNIFFGDLNDPFPKDILDDHFDYIISYVSPWIVPKKLLDNTKKAAINFHPGPPEYPGIGCTNFAIYNNEKEFGITVHHMEKKVDSGKIILVKRFPIFSNDTVYSLTQRCYAYIYISFIEIFQFILENKPLPISTEYWKREPYTRNELNELCRITKDMSEEEIKRRVKATTFPNKPGAFITLGGFKFILDNTDEE